MPYILMPNNVKVFVNETSYTQQEVSYQSILYDLNSPCTMVDRRIAACRVCNMLGPLGVDFTTALEQIVYTGNEISLIQAALSALERICPGKYEGEFYQKRLNEMKKTNQHLSSVAELREQQKSKKESTETPTEMNKKPTTMIDIVQEDGEKPHESLSRKCNFCEKETTAYPERQRLIEKLCPPNKFFCNHCLRNNLHNKDNKHTLMLTFRAIFGYFYYEFYQHPKVPKMWLSEIQDHISLHVRTGMNNPVFNYDQESYVWFIDFRKVGESKKKISVKDVQSTIVDILATFNLPITIPAVHMNKLYQKYDEAVSDFYTKRYRPEGKKLLCPTLKNCGNVLWSINPPTHWQTAQTQSQKMTLEDTKNFLPHIIEPEKYWKKTAAL